MDRINWNLSSEIFENTIFADAVFETKLFPELHTDLIPALSDLKRYDFSRHFCSSVRREISRVLEGFLYYLTLTLLSLTGGEELLKREGKTITKKKQRSKWWWITIHDGWRWWGGQQGEIIANFETNQLSNQ